MFGSDRSYIDNVLTGKLVELTEYTLTSSPRVLLGRCGTVRPKCEEVDCGDVELAGGGIEGRRAPRKVRLGCPGTPRNQEHNITHLPLWSWCVHCVRGRGEQPGHRRQEARPENAIPEVHTDYRFMERKSDDVQPTLVARDGDTRMTVRFLVQRKGVVNDHMIKRLLQFFRELGYHENNVVIRSDQGSPMRAVGGSSRRRGARRRPSRRWSARCTP